MEKQPFVSEQPYGFPPEIHKPRPGDLDSLFPLNQEFIYYQRQLEQRAEQKQVLDLIEKNVLKLLGEHLAQLPQDEFFYEIREDAEGRQRMFFAGMSEPMVEGLKRVAEKSGNTSREMAEYLGIKAVEDALLGGKSNVAIQISPPSFGREGFGNYGFVFVFVREEDIVRTFVLRYDGEAKNLALSSEYYEKFLRSGFNVVDGTNGIETSLKAEILEEEKAFLSQVLTKKMEGEDLYLFLSRIFGKQISPNISREFYQKLKSDPFFSKLLEHYKNAMLSGDIEKAKILRRALWNIADEILHSKEVKVYGEIDDNLVQEFMRMYSGGVFIGQTSCPSSVLLSAADFSEWKGLPAYLSFSFEDWDQFGARRFTCPHCFATVVRPYGELVVFCPECGGDVRCEGTKVKNSNDQ